MRAIILLCAAALLTAGCAKKDEGATDATMTEPAPAPADTAPPPPSDPNADPNAAPGTMPPTDETPPADQTAPPPNQ